MHLSLLFELFVPAGHMEQFVELRIEYDPIAQSEHSDESSAEKYISA